MQDFSNGIYFTAKAPYPPIEVEGENKMYARAMLDNLGGQNSEMTAVASYFYNHVVSVDFEDISKIFNQISVVEMRHMEIFAELSKILGEDQRLWTKRGRGTRYWTPEYVTYTTDICKLLENSLNGEKEAIAKYEYQEQNITDKSIKRILRRIIMDEEVHVDIFNRLIDKYCE